MEGGDAPRYTDAAKGCQRYAGRSEALYHRDKEKVRDKTVLETELVAGQPRYDPNYSHVPCIPKTVMFSITVCFSALPHAQPACMNHGVGV